MSIEVADLVASLRGEDLNFTALMARADTAVQGLGAHTTGVITTLGTLSLTLGGLAGGALLASARAAADFQTTLVQVQNNTTMTAADIAIMRHGILQLASGSNASLSSLADGFMHITNFGFSARDAVEILRQAMMSATSTGGDTAATANMLANALHEFGASAGQAAQYMDVLHLAAAQGNATLEQFVDSSGRALAMAANMSVSLTDVGAALAALTRHGQDSAQASTLIAGALAKIANPAIGTEKYIRQLSAATGVDLVHDFTAAGLASKGLSGVMNDIGLATHGNAQEILKLIPATRGGLAALILTGTGAKDYRQILLSLNDAMTGRVHPTLMAFQRIQATVGFQMGELWNKVQILGITIGSVLLPPLVNLVGCITNAVTAFANWVSKSSGLQSAISALKTFIDTQLTPKLQALWGVIQSNILPALGSLATFIKDNIVPRLADFAAGVGGILMTNLKNLWTLLSSNLSPALSTLGGWVKGVLSDFRTWANGHAAVVQALQTIAANFLLFAVGSRAYAAVLAILAVLGRLALAFAAKSALGIAVALFATAWQKNWGDIQGKVQTVWGVIHPILSAMGSLLDGLHPGAGAVAGFVALSGALLGLAAALQAVSEAGGALGIIKGLAGLLGGGGGKGGGGSGPGTGADKAMQDLTAAIIRYFRDLNTCITTHFRDLNTCITTHFRDLNTCITTHVPPLVTAITTVITALNTNITTVIKALNSAITIEVQDLTKAINAHIPDLTNAIKNLHVTVKGGGGTLTVTGAGGLQTAISTYFPPLTSAITTTLGALNTTLKGFKITFPKLPALTLDDTNLRTSLDALTTAITNWKPGHGTGSGHGTATVAVTVDLKKALQDAVNALAHSPIDLTPALYLNAGTLRADLQKAVSAIKPVVDMGTALTIADMRALLVNAVHAVKPVVDMGTALVIKDMRALLVNAVRGVTTPVDLTPALTVKGLLDAIKGVLSGPIEWGSALANFAKSFWQGIFSWIASNAGALILGPINWGSALANFARSFWTAVFDWLKNNIGSLLSGLPGILSKVLSFSAQNGGGPATNASYQHGQNLGLDAAFGGASGQPMQLSLQIDGKQLATILFQYSATDRRMRPEMVST